MIKHGIDQDALIGKFSQATAKPARRACHAGHVIDQLTIWQAANSPER